MKTAVEQLEKQILDNWMGILTGKVNIGDFFEQAKKMEKEQSIHKLFVGFQEWHKNEYGSKYVEIDQFDEYLETFKSK